MFHRLRYKLTLINVSIILILFLLLIAGAYWFAQTKISKFTDNLAQKIVSDIQTGRINDLPSRNEPRPMPPSGPPLGLPLPPPPGPPPGPNFFFVKTSPAGAIISQSSVLPLNSEGLAALTAQALQGAASQGTIVFEQTKYSYVRAPLTTQPGMLVLYHDLTHDTNILRVVLTALLAVGLICSLLSFAASFFMANRAMKPIKKAWQQQSDFLSDASHELRTPLSVIQINLDILRGSPDDTVSSQSKWLDNIQEESKCMINLVDSLLFLARADSQQQPLHKQPYSFTTLLTRAVAPFEAVAAAKGLSLEVAAAVAGNDYGDELRIKQVVTILLDNAIRHTSVGTISVSLSQSNANTQLSVTDSGEGIEPEHLTRIFDRFYQVDTSRRKGGSGLGLAIAKWIIESHDGTIAVTSTPGVGTTFVVQLPRKPDA
ncbi:sensor histidine kinase [Sporomusa malonica]|uniref:histidine kinase n=1 Tax=Sporomusa malonica TaxID=112901 RepID=A0A1W2EJC7_9FIRM|nr:ATP-binding protein [Sporomusa malonica]SMD09820.1 His Kinase A (phospho-acceptor) domain-containing protein [Sporomusa malonica]